MPGRILTAELFCLTVDELQVETFFPEIDKLCCDSDYLSAVDNLRQKLKLKIIGSCQMFKQISGASA